MNRSTVPISALHAPVISRPFGVVLTVSLVLHVGLLAGYAFWDSRQMSIVEFPEEPIKASLVRLGKPRDQKLLPRVETAPKPAAAPKEKEVPVPTLNAPKEKAPEKEDKQDRKQQEDKMKNALARIQDEAEKDTAREQALARIAQRVGKAEPEEGQEDGHPEGDSPNATQVNAYLGLLASRVKQHYQVPSVISPGECARLVAVVMVRMGADGQVLEAKVHKSSGQELFDSAVISAVKQASPLPKPPDNMLSMVKTGFGFNFRCPQ